MSREIHFILLKKKKKKKDHPFLPTVWSVRAFVMVKHIFCSMSFYFNLIVGQ